MHLKKTSKSVNFCPTILILKLEEDMQHFWYIMLCYFKKGKNTTETPKKDVCVCGEAAVTDGMCQKCFPKFLRTTDILAK